MRQMPLVRLEDGGTTDHADERHPQRAVDDGDDLVPAGVHHAQCVAERLIRTEGLHRLGEILGDEQRLEGAPRHERLAQAVVRHEPYHPALVIHDVRPEAIAAQIRALREEL